MNYSEDGILSQAGFSVGKFSAEDDVNVSFILSSQFS